MIDSLSIGSISCTLSQFLRPRGPQETVEAAPESSRRALQMSNLARPTGRSPKEVMSDRAKRVAKALYPFGYLDGLGAILYLHTRARCTQAAQLGSPLTIYTQKLQYPSKAWRPGSWVLGRGSVVTGRGRVGRETREARGRGSLPSRRRASGIRDFGSLVSLGRLLLLVRLHRRCTRPRRAVGGLEGGGLELRECERAEGAEAGDGVVALDGGDATIVPAGDVEEGCAMCAADGVGARHECRYNASGTGSTGRPAHRLRWRRGTGSRSRGSCCGRRRSERS